MDILEHHTLMRVVNIVLRQPWQHESLSSSAQDKLGDKLAQAFGSDHTMEHKTDKMNKIYQPIDMLVERYNTTNSLEFTSKLPLAA